MEAAILSTPKYTHLHSEAKGGKEARCSDCGNVWRIFVPSEDGISQVVVAGFREIMSDYYPI